MSMCELCCLVKEKHDLYFSFILWKNWLILYLLLSKTICTYILCCREQDVHVHYVLDFHCKHCGWPDGHTDRFYSVLTFWVNNKQISVRPIAHEWKLFAHNFVHFENKKCMHKIRFLMKLVDDKKKKYKNRPFIMENSLVYIDIHSNEYSLIFKSEGSLFLVYF